ncbi:MAG: TIGR04084 family radical SAM/SPASM domain-containing protein [archaeon]
MIYHVITTPECNLCCAYCGEKAFCEPDLGIEFEPVPQKPQYSAYDLTKFLRKDKDKPISIVFYGGEPLMNIEFIMELMDSQKKYKVIDNFLIQTNGILLDKLPKEYVNKFHTILVSIDGGKSITNKNRGEGTWEKVTSNLKLIKANGFKGEIIARMAIEEPTDFYEDILELIDPKNPDGFTFTSVHWQLDANMWHDYDKRNFSKWSKEYNIHISHLADYWISQLNNGYLIRLYPFIGIVDSLINGTNYYLRCGSGIGNFTILPNGKISVCPIMSGVKENYLGDIKSTDPKSLPFKLKVGEPCTSCGDFELCGGRCLYSNLHPAWPKKGIIEVCETIRHLINEMKRVAPEVELIIKEKKINAKDLKFLKYNCAEIIP